MTTVYFVRHAEPNYDNHDDNTRELTAKGLADRERVTAYLADKQIGAVLSSPYKRAYDTVKPFADQSGLTIRTIDDFRERRVDSVWIEDFHAFSRRQWADFNYKLSDGECLREVLDRYLSGLSLVLTEYAGQNVVIGSHGTALSTLVDHFAPSFGYAGFESIRRVMPWIVRFVFDDAAQCVALDGFDPLSGVRTDLLHP